MDYFTHLKTNPARSCPRRYDHRALPIKRGPSNPCACIVVVHRPRPARSKPKAIEDRPQNLRSVSIKAIGSCSRYQKWLSLNRVSIVPSVLDLSDIQIPPPDIEKAEKYCQRWVHAQSS